MESQGAVLSHGVLSVQQGELRGVLQGDASAHA